MSEQDETLEYISGFVEEGREMLDNAEPCFMDLDKLINTEDGVDADTVNTLFRMFHTFKGVASFLNLDVITKLTHQAENFLDKVRSNQVKLTHEHIDILCETGDFLREALDVLEAELSDESLAEGAKYYMDKYSGETGGHDVEHVEKSMPVEDVTVHQESSENEETEVEPTSDDVESENILQHDPELLKQFVIESEELLSSIEEDLISFEQDTSDVEKFNSVFRNFHSFKGNCGFFGFSDLEQLCHKCETIFDYLRGNSSGFDQSINSNFLSIISIIRESMSNIKSSGTCRIPSVKALVSILDDLFEIIKSGVADPEQSEILSHIVENMVDMIALDNERMANVGDGENKVEVKQSRKKSNAQTASRSRAQSIRVDTDKLDVLLNLVGELVVAQSMLTNSPDLLALDANLPVFSKRMDEMKKISRDIQEASMSMRMLPIEPMFKKMIRLVRDVSVKSKKEVNLILKGGDTEVDKNLIENLSDPLVHILRNAVDHGIEIPEDRLASGKQPEGQLILEAMHANGEVWIRVHDDGKGLDREKILEKAIKNGIADEHTEYSDEEVFDFIFKPGFSTAEKVTNISGRGVGMDVVRTQIEAMKGSVNIQSIKGSGSIFTLRIPLTMAILDGMIVSVDKRFYALPIASISESFQFDESKIITMSDGKEMIGVREHFLPVFRLSKYYKTSDRDKNEGILMILSHDNDQICVFVDEIIGQQQIVLKPLPQFVGNVKCISGCAILSGGKLSMVLDARELIHTAS